MRLGQIARKLALRQKELIDFLSANGIQISEGSNIRLEDEHVVLIMKKYAPAHEQDMIAELAIEKANADTISEDEPDKTEEEVIVSSLPEFTHQVSEVKPEVIRVAKIELSGLKVLGKVDLPETKKKEVDSSSETDSKIIDSTSQVQKKMAKGDRNTSQQKKDRRNSPNPIALHREREAREIAKKMRDKDMREKEKRKQHYFNKVKSIKPNKSVKQSKPDTIVLLKEEIPTSLLGKFWKWLKP